MGETPGTYRPHGVACWRHTDTGFFGSLLARLFGKRCRGGLLVNILVLKTVG
jgi:hypothetical protein